MDCKKTIESTLKVHSTSLFSVLRDIRRADDEVPLFYDWDYLFDRPIAGMTVEGVRD